MEAIAKLQSFKARLVEYLKLKVEQADWHGVSDAANDIREVEADIRERILRTADRSDLLEGL